MRCLRIRVSTVNRRYAAVYRRNPRRGCLPHQGDGVAVFKRKKRSGWKFVVAGSSFDCPVPKVPPRVVEDLRIPCF